MEKLSRGRTALNRCMQTESCWNKKNLRDRHQYYYYYYHHYFYNIDGVHEFKQAQVKGTVTARWGTWLVRKGKEVSFETEFKRTNGW